MSVYTFCTEPGIRYYNSPSIPAFDYIFIIRRKKYLGKSENFAPRQRAPQVGKNMPGKMKFDVLNRGKKTFPGQKNKKPEPHQQ